MVRFKGHNTAPFSRLPRQPTTTLRHFSISPECSANRLLCGYALRVSCRGFSHVLITTLAPVPLSDGV